MDRHYIDHTHSRAICDEIGERLRTQLKLPREERTDLDDKIDELSAIERKQEVY